MDFSIAGIRRSLEEGLREFISTVENDIGGGEALEDIKGWVENRNCRIFVIEEMVYRTIRGIQTLKML